MLSDVSNIMLLVVGTGVKKACYQMCLEPALDEMIYLLA